MTVLQVFVLMMLSISAALAQQRPLAAPDEGKAAPKTTPAPPDKNIRTTQPPLGKSDAVIRRLKNPMKR
jgi:predicted small lipoprotein YifL